MNILDSVENPDFIDIDTAAKLLGLHRTRLLKAINDGDLTAVEGIWKGHRVTLKWLDAWLASNTVNVDKAGGDAA